MAQRTYLVPFIPGGTSVSPTGEVMLTVTYIAGGFARDINGMCAFCHGDPCAESSPESSLIWRYMNTPPIPGTGWMPKTCPMCGGRPS